MSQNTVIVHFDQEGEIYYHVIGDGVRLFIVDERAPHDRVYEWLPRAEPYVLDVMIPEGSTIGSNQDERHAAIEHMVLRHMGGKAHLSVVESPEGEG